MYLWIDVGHQPSHLWDFVNHNMYVFSSARNLKSSCNRIGLISQFLCINLKSNGCKETDTVRYDYLQNNVKSPQKKKYMHTHTTI